MWWVVLLTFVLAFGFGVYAGPILRGDLAKLEARLQLVEQALGLRKTPLTATGTSTTAPKV